MAPPSLGGAARVSSHEWAPLARGQCEHGEPSTRQPAQSHEIPSFLCSGQRDSSLQAADSPAKSVCERLHVPSEEKAPLRVRGSFLPRVGLAACSRGAWRQLALRRVATMWSAASSQPLEQPSEAWRKRGAFAFWRWRWGEKRPARRGRSAERGEELLHAHARVAALARIVHQRRMACPDPQANSAPDCGPAPTGEPGAVCRARVVHQRRMACPDQTRIRRQIAGRPPQASLGQSVAQAGA
jgi:hypothetical protein